MPRCIIGICTATLLIGELTRQSPKCEHPVRALQRMHITHHLHPEEGYRAYSRFRLSSRSSKPAGADQRDPPPQHLSICSLSIRRANSTSVGLYAIGEYSSCGTVPCIPARASATTSVESSCAYTAAPGHRSFGSCGASIAASLPYYNTCRHDQRKPSLRIYYATERSFAARPAAYFSSFIRVGSKRQSQEALDLSVGRRYGSAAKWSDFRKVLLLHVLVSVAYSGSTAPCIGLSALTAILAGFAVDEH